VSYAFSHHRACWFSWLILAALFFIGFSPTTAQIATDTTQVADTLTSQEGIERAEQDSISADTIYYNLPDLKRWVPSGFGTGIWTWSREDIMVSGANTLSELVALVPGVIELLGGDYGTPAAVSAFGVGGGGVRVTRDGFEVLPVEGGVPDLQRIGLAGIDQVKLERNGGELLIELTSHRHVDGRPFSVVEAGTGQLDTNMFRGMYADPTALGGSLALALERVDTRGFGRDEGGNRTGSWFRYQMHRGDRVGLSLEYRNMSSGTQVPEYASSLSRRDLTARVRAEVLDGLVAEAYTGSTRHEVNDTLSRYELEGGSRGQHGMRLAFYRNGLWARGAYRLYSHSETPSSRTDGSGGYTHNLFGVSGRVSQSSWSSAFTSEEPTLTQSYGGRVWAGPMSGITFFGSWESGSYAGRSGPILKMYPDQASSFSKAERTTTRAGGSFTWFNTTLSVAHLRADADIHLPLGLELDRGSQAVAGTERLGAEAWASLPTIWNNLRFVGSYQQWDQDGPYLPKRIYRGAFVFHKVYLDSGNFEMWWSLGVRGHDPMSVFVSEDGLDSVSGLQVVPFYQNWYGRIQVRIVSVRLFLGWENFIRRRNLQNFPGRILPITRSFFGLRWDLWS
jgi:hypothetical protein